MRIIVTSLTGAGRGLEIHAEHARLKIRRLVAVDTGNGTMGSAQLELRGAVIELGEIPPALHRMTGHATLSFTVFAQSHHSLTELSLMGIQMTTCTGQVREPVLRYFCELGCAPLFMTVATSYGYMCAP
jgi:hypothetical protein